MIIPWQQLEENTLNNLITEFVSRYGTDNGDNSELSTRIHQVMEQLRQGSAIIVWDELTETANIVPRSDISIA
ncbi:YheU family protein [Sansalvadorimonas verongulae]|uniref:YheU family protein n=1 Tax=Sansalvadorimonas verongulae TaxID=2172824 RepID=UPI0012BBD076|nr:YheU family protein [Sansalvadorimonas verongulae]MTI13778.1 YheU family protein [Sansalvadorimonas verongulae]